MIAANPIQLVDADYWLLVDAVTDYAIFHLDPQGAVLTALGNSQVNGALPRF
jgi:hypothetical protein